MDTSFKFWPDQASSFAPKVDALYAFLLSITAIFTVLIFVLIVYFGLKYRRKPGVKPTEIPTSHALELTWSIIPFLLTMLMFAWGAGLYMHIRRPPDDAMQIDVIGKQWMWKVQHPNGKREINELHVPIGRPVKLIMTSQDVIHSFFMPAFRIKMDVLPGRYTTQWFNATKVGEYHLFCAEYCGNQHSGMVGKVIVMDPAKYQSWLAGVPADEAPVVAGEKLFTQYACITCHGQRGPGLVGVYNTDRHVVEDGKPITVKADDNYLRESILNPSRKIVAGFQPLMPTYAGQLSEEQVLSLLAYIKSLKTETGTNPQQPQPPASGR